MDNAGWFVEFLPFAAQMAAKKVVRFDRAEELVLKYTGKQGDR